jgi:hypothetical protein
MGILIDLFNNIGLFTFISSVSLTININSGGLFYYIILSAINKSVISLLNSEFTVFAFVPLVCYIYNPPSFKPERLRYFSLNEKRAPYRFGSRYSAHFNIPR